MRRWIAIPGFLVMVFVATAPSVAADFRIERRLALEPGRRFVLDADAVSVVATGDSSNGALVIVTAQRDDLMELFDFQFEEPDGGVRVTAKRKQSWTWWRAGGWFGLDPRVEIHVPRDTEIDLRTSGGSIDASAFGRSARVRTSGGSVRIWDVVGDVDGHTSGGSINVRQIRGAAMVSTSGGSIDVSGVAGNVQAETSGGGIRIDGVAGQTRATTHGGTVFVRGAGDRVDARTSGGSVTVAFSPGVNRGGDLATTGGSVRAEVDPGVSLSIDASTSGGSVTTEMPVTTREASKHRLLGDLNGGGALLRLHTSGGGIRIASAR